MIDGEPQIYLVRLGSRRTEREIDALPNSDYRRVYSALQELAKDPRPSISKKLYDNVYRIRIGAWRVIYLVDDGAMQIIVGAIRRRSEGTYRRIRDLFS